MSDTQPAMTYPTTDQYERWSDRADELDMSKSEFMAAMIEAGMKKFEATVEPDETNSELRQQRNDLKDELAHTRDRVADLEEQIHRGERATIGDHIEDHPEGVEFGEVVQHVIDTAPERVNRHLEDFEGDNVHAEGDRYYPTDGDEVSQ